jgi:hypothetical protein
MLNQTLIVLVNSVLGTGKSTSKGNYAYSCPFCKHHKPKLEINFTENEKGENPWHCWACDRRGKKIYQIFKSIGTPTEINNELNSLVKSGFVEKQIIIEEKVTLPKEFKPLNNIQQSNIIGRHALHYIK